jgi:hypothetical protein
MSIYNGWSNWETWNCNLHHQSQFLSLTENLVKEKPDADMDEMIDSLAASFEEYVETSMDIEKIPDGFVKDLLSSTCHRINWDEIARAMINIATHSSSVLK